MSTPLVQQDAWIGDVHRFWFEALEPAAWFRSDPALDATIRERFGDLYRSLADADLSPAIPRAAVAAVIVFDQLPRNMFRGTPAAFATDMKALRLSRAAVAAGFDRHLGVRERQFLYMPFQHSEDRAIQKQSVELFEGLGLPDLLGYAEGHRAIIERFGRFPHRNAILGRASSDEEADYLRTARPF